MLKDSLDFSGKVAIVTGGATGIGYATALQLASLGASVVIASRTEDELLQSAQRIAEQTGSPCLGIRTDVKKESDCVALVEKTIAAFGRIVRVPLM